MSIEAPIKTISNGLVLHLDAGNAKSYPGTGTVWTDISRNGYNGTLTGATFSSTGGGSVAFDGVDDYVSFSTAILAGRSELTVAMYVYPTQSGNNGSLFAEGYNPGEWWQFNIITSIWYTRDTSTGTTGARNNDLSIDYLTLNKWNFITAVYSVTGGYKRYFVNAVQVATTSTSIDTLTTDRNPAQSFLGRPTDPATASDKYFKGNISQVSLYSRALTPTEILQNYDSTRSRFGL